MTQLLSGTQLAQIKKALGDVVDTFYVTILEYHKRVVTEDTYGENAVVTPTVYMIRAKVDYSVGHGGRYGDVDNTAEGKIQHSTWHVRLWADDVAAAVPVGGGAAGFTIDAESDSIVYMGKEYRFNFAAESGTFSGLGNLAYEIEIRYE